MQNKLLHTPEGFRDIYGNEIVRKSNVKHTLADTIRKYGYLSIETPSVEYFDVFSKNIGTIPSKELYKFFDKEGNTLCLRPDFTPSIARVAATYFADANEPLKFYYSGSTFVNRNDHQGKLKESTQVGAELMGDASVEADYEIILMMLDCADSLSISEFQVTIGNVEYFKGLCEEIDTDTELSLREMISNKNYFGAKAILDATTVSSEKKEIILNITSLFGGEDSINKALEMADNDRSRAAALRLKALDDLLKKDGKNIKVTYDFGMLSNYNYYTGIVAKGYTYGSGDAIFKGGRYDNLVKEFGKDLPAVGFAASVDQIAGVIAHREKN